MQLSKNTPCAILLLFGMCWFHAGAQQRHARLVWDTTALTELYNSLPIGFVFGNGEQEQKTEGWLHGRIRWSHLKVTVSPGTFQDGELSFDREAANENGHQVHISLAPAGDPADSQRFTLPVPYVTQIRFRPFTDSLKRGIAYDLNIEATYSSGRIFPMDTSEVSLSASAGILEGSSLLLPAGDTSTADITVKAMAKAGASLWDSLTIPVKKIWDPFRPMPSEQSVLQHLRQKKRR